MSDIKTQTVRESMMRDLAAVPDYAEAIGKNQRFVQRGIANNSIPHIRIGKTPYVIISAAREALLAGPQPIKHAPVRRGRPKTAT